MDKAEAWIAFAALLVTIFVVSGGGLWALLSKMDETKNLLQADINSLKKTLDEEVNAIRSAAFVEYKDLRRELNELVSKMYLDFGEAPKALREKIGQVELWIRDNLLPRKEYERDQDQILDSIKLLTKVMETRFTSLDGKFDEIRREKE